MRVKSLVAYLAVALLMVAAIATGVALLYGGTGQSGDVKDSGSLLARNPALAAVPSDAVAVLCFSDFAEELDVLGDRTKVLGALVGAYEGSAVAGFLQECRTLVDGHSHLKNAASAVSLNFSGNLVPVFSLDVERCDTSLVAELCRIADDSGLKSRRCGDFLAISVSDALTLSVERHVKNGVSILSNEGFVNCMSRASSKNLVIFANEHAGRIFNAYLGRSLSRYSSFFKSYSSWTMMSIDERKDERLRMSVVAYNPSGPQYYSGVLDKAKAGELRFADAVPSSTIWVVAMSLQDRDGLISRYSAYMDALSRLTANSRDRSALVKRTGISPDDWAGALDLKEIVRLSWRFEPDAEPCSAVLLRAGRKGSSLLPVADEVADYAYSGFTSNLLGSIFRVDDESCCFLHGEWLAFGSREAMEDLLARMREGDTLAALLSDASASSMLPGRAVMAAYFSPSICSMDATFASGMKKAVDGTFDGAAYEPCVLIHSGGSMSLEVRRSAAFENLRTPALVSDARLLVPTGPFEVTNSSTGEKNILQQQSNNYISLKDANGKGIWSIPFSAPICGAVECIDYYANGKIQFLFCSGSSLYLLDRLGRFVKDFPADMGKEVLLGPAVYDFSGAHGYTVQVLHKDNSIGMYNIHGKLKDGWEGISCEDSIIALPELLELGGRKYWIVRTAREALIYGFNGGQPLRRESGSKSIRRDSSFEPTDKGSVKVTCNDGKERTIKLNDTNK